MRALIFLFLLTSCFIPKDFSTDSTRHNWGNLHWPRASNPIEIQVVSHLSPEYEKLLPIVLKEWEESGLVIFHYEGTVNSCKSMDGYILVYDDNFGDIAWYGLATVWTINKEYIYKGTIQLNSFYSKMINPAAKQHVLCQEVGHILGLSHQKESDSCMNDESDLTNENYMHPNLNDYYELSRIYGNSY